MARAGKVAAPNRAENLHVPPLRCTRQPLCRHPPDALRRLGIAIPQEAADAAQAREKWSAAAIEALCGWPDGTQPEGAKGHRSDGLLVGPFGNASPWDLLIVNTDGSLTERSGNGMTLFAQALLDDGHVAPGQAFVLHVHHDKPGGGTPVVTPIEPAERDGRPGFWLQMGAPGFGPEAVGADGEHLAAADFHGRFLSRVDALAQVNPGGAAASSYASAIPTA